ncbi:MAG: alpha/beta hydrolase [Prolixibacteraceae bacterium]|nr:alpha/beta hydrolase [Prolixibacteraceae bacterium]
MKTELRIYTFLIFLCLHYYSSSQVVSEDIIIGEKIQLASKILDYDPEIYVSLPADYTDSINYPLVILHDAGWLFEGFAGITKLMGQMEEIQPCIVVGIPLKNDYVEYAPKITGAPQSGNADKVLKFYSDELFPYMELNYRCSEERIIWAHSGLAGLFCTYILLGECTQFSGIISSSPNLRWVQEYITKEDAFDALSRKGAVFYYLSFGSNEEEEYQGEMYTLIKEFKSKLEKEAPENLKWVYRFNEHNNHFTNAVESYIDGLKLYFETKK